VDISGVAAEGDNGGKSEAHGAGFFQPIIYLPFNLNFCLSGKQAGPDKSKSSVEESAAVLN